MSLRLGKTHLSSRHQSILSERTQPGGQTIAQPVQSVLTASCQDSSANSTVIAMSTMDSVNVRLASAVRVVVELFVEVWPMEKRVMSDQRTQRTVIVTRVGLVWKILDMLPGRPPQVSFTCDIPTSTCQFKFWIGSVEFFYCSFEECNQSIQSYVIFLPEEIKGPGKFSCLSDQQGCRIEEPAMNQLISDIFGDTSITLNCQSGECMHYTKVPGFLVPVKIIYFGTTVGAELTSIQLSKVVLREVSGKAKSGEFMAIMGAFGAGKSSLLDVLAKKNKSGTVEDKILINDKQISNNYLKNRNRADVFIGKSGRRSISGGEKRRVSIACELVTSPSILFLVEPTIGLDSFNAYNVIESHAGLAKNYKRTVVFTIHQPQSNILALFDQLILLGSGGQLIFSGAFSKCHDSFENIEYPCPSGYNIADVLIDLMMTSKSRSTTPIGSEPIPSGKYLGNGTQLVSPHAESQQLNEELGGAEPHTIKTSYDSADSSQTKRKQKLSNMSQESSSRLRSILADSENDGSFLDELNQLFAAPTSQHLGDSSMDTSQFQFPQAAFTTEVVLQFYLEAISKLIFYGRVEASNLIKPLIYKMRKSKELQPSLLAANSTPGIDFQLCLEPDVPLELKLGKLKLWPSMRKRGSLDTGDRLRKLQGLWAFQLSSAFRLFNKANGLKVLVNRIKEEVDIAVSQCSTDNPSALKSSEVLIGILHQCSASLLKALTRSIQRLLTSAGTSEGVRNLNETKPSSAIKLIMQNRSILPTEIQTSQQTVHSIFVRDEPLGSYVVYSRAKLGAMRAMCPNGDSNSGVSGSDFWTHQQEAKGLIRVAYESVKSIDVLDTTPEGTHRWTTAEAAYYERVSKVENQITSRLRARLGPARNATEISRVFSKFNTLFVRPKIRDVSL
ncbi:hypothetical protein BY996DRAFT_6422045 [Phakopsora pachyrhizi]|nr:hypothetical protein BY996DRAFT_6422045 [Phakopsora pachyrhizi]